MLWSLEQRGGGRELDDPPSVHDSGAAADVLDQPEVMRDEQICQSELLLQVHQQVHDLSLDGDIEGGDRFVENEKRRTEGEGARQTDPLPLTTTELVRVSLEVRRVEADEAEQLPHARAALGPASQPMDHER